MQCLTVKLPESREPIARSLVPALLDPQLPSGDVSARSFRVQRPLQGASERIPTYSGRLAFGADL